MADTTTPGDLLKVIRGNKGLTAVAIGIVALLLWYLYKQSQAVNAGNAAASTTPAAGAAPTSFAPATGTYTYVQKIYEPPTSTAPAATTTPVAVTVTPTVPITVTPAPVTVVATTPPPTSTPISSQGLLGPNVRFFPNYKNGVAYYRSPATHGQIVPIPLPANTTYQPGPNGRVWYQSPPGSKGQLLTSGG